MLAAVLLRHADDQLLADVAREVEVDVGHRRQLAVEEAPEREVRRHRVDVREPGQVADERADGGAAAAAGREHVPHRPGPAHLERDLARKLEHLPVEQEEAGETEVADQHELLVETGEHAPLVAVQPGVAFRERALADAAKLDDRRLVPVGEVGIAVAELLRQVEAEPVGELDGARDRVPVVREALEHVGGSGEHALVVAAPLALAAVEGGAAANRDEHVLEHCTARVVRVRVAGGDRRDTERRRKLAERGIAPRVAALVRPLQLDEEVVPAEDPGEPRRRVRVADGEPVPRAAGKADEPLVQLLEQRRVERRRQRAPGPPSAASASARR